MREFFIDVFNYQHEMNLKLIDQLIPIEADFAENLYQLFSHILNAQQIWNSRINSTTAFQVNQAHPKTEFITLEKSNYNTSLSIIQERDLAETIHYQTSKGLQFKNRISEILYHTSNHSTHHRAQIIAVLRQNNISPIVSDYIFWKR
ncbi:MAG: damage-inducible protein DinB [Calditrichaeota bacterium]|nr:damage-inducible protein DinB [Calditrichota bacterium]